MASHLVGNVFICFVVAVLVTSLSLVQGAQEVPICHVDSKGYYPGKVSYFPSEVAPVKSVCVKYHISGLECPNWSIFSRGLEGFNPSFSNTTTNTTIYDTNCTSTFTTEYSENPKYYRSPAEELVLECLSNKVLFWKLNITIRRSDNGGPCKKNIDCFVKRQICNSEKCSCPDSEKIYKSDGCIPVRLLGMACNTSKECQIGDPRSFCSDAKKCECQRPYTAADLKCRGSNPGWVIGSKCNENGDCSTYTVNSLCSKYDVCECQTNYQLRDGQCNTGTKWDFSWVAVIFPLLGASIKYSS